MYTKRYETKNTHFGIYLMTVYIYLLIILYESKTHHLRTIIYYDIDYRQYTMFFFYYYNKLLIRCLI